MKVGDRNSHENLQAEVERLRTELTRRERDTKNQQRENGRQQRQIDGLQGQIERQKREIERQEAGDRATEGAVGRRAPGGVPTSRPLRQGPTARTRPASRSTGWYAVWSEGVPPAPGTG